MRYVGTKVHLPAVPGFEEPGASLQRRAMPSRTLACADRQVALIAERGRPADRNRAPSRRYAWPCRVVGAAAERVQMGCLVRRSQPGFGLDVRMGSVKLPPAVLGRDAPKLSLLAGARHDQS
jgi:hypothetical protein